MMFMISAVMVSCSDKDGGSLDNPKYEKDAARFTITSANSPYSSIELTASGNYLITEKDNQSSLLKMPSHSGSNDLTRGNMFNPVREVSTRDSYSGVIYGKYTINSNGDYVLEGFGTIKVQSNGGTSVDLEITTNSGQSIVVGANRDNMMTQSDMTNKLCRTWKFSKVHVMGWEEGKKIFDKTLSMEEYWEYDDDDVDFEDMPENVIFTKAGTYLVTYKNGTLAISTWRWDNEKEGILRYSWDYEHLDDEYESGTVQVNFDGNKLLIIEDDYDEEYDERYYIEWILTED